MSNVEYEAFAARELEALLRYGYVLCGDRELASDLVQDVMLKAYVRWDQVGAADHPRLYVRTMVTRAYLSWRRRWLHRVRASVELDDNRLPVSDHAGDVVLRDAVWRRLATLPPRQRAVLVLRFYEQLSDAEIGQVLGCAPATVRGYASRALAALRLDETTPSTATLTTGREH